MNTKKTLLSGITTMTPEPATKNTPYRSVRYHCAACSFAFDISGFIPEEKLPQEPILLCPRCNGPALRVTAEQADILQKFIKLREQATCLILERMEQAGYYKSAETIKQTLNISKP